MRNKSDEKKLLVGFDKDRKSHPEAAIIAGVVGPTSDGQDFMCEVNSLGLTAPRLVMLIIRLLETASKWARRDGLTDLAVMIETANSCFDPLAADTITRH